MTGVRSGDRDTTIEWRTYTPDGRMLTVRRTDAAWVAACGDGEDYASERLVDAIRDAVGHERGESLTLGAGTHRSMEQWVAEQAQRIERDAGA